MMAIHRLMTTQPPEDQHDARTHEWARLQTVLHVREAIRSLRSAARSVEDAVAAAVQDDERLDRTLDLVGAALASLSRVEARIHDEDELQARSGRGRA